MGLLSALPGRRQGLAHTGFTHHPATDPFPDSNAPHGPFSAKANPMDNNEKKDVNEESRARRLTLVRDEAREVMPHQAPKLELIVNAERKLFEAVMANDSRQSL